MKNLTQHKPISQDGSNIEQQFTTYIALNKVVSRGEALLVLMDCTIFAKSGLWEDTECFQAQCPHIKSSETIWNHSRE